VHGTVAAIERELCEDGLVHRYTQRSADVDGLPPGEGAFLACTFWLADAYAMTGRRTEAITTFERLLDLRNDVGLLAKEYDPVARRQLGNFPQAFSHVPLINTARLLSRPGGPVRQQSCDAVTHRSLGGGGRAGRVRTNVLWDCGPGGRPEIRPDAPHLKVGWVRSPAPAVPPQRPQRANRDPAPVSAGVAACDRDAALQDR
jgi:hypothetical protein